MANCGTRSIVYIYNPCRVHNAVDYVLSIEYLVDYLLRMKWNCKGKELGRAIYGEGMWN